MLERKVEIGILGDCVPFITPKSVTIPLSALLAINKLVSNYVEQYGCENPDNVFLKIGRLCDEISLMEIEIYCGD